jgi:hypothetical protein
VTSTSIIPSERIERSILLLREQKVMFDADLAELYGVETKVLLQAIRRNAARGAQRPPLPALRVHRTGRCDAV